jgi:hypothetical protein
MKNIIYLFLITFCFKMSAQNHAFKVNPIAFAFKGFELSYENKAGKNNSFELIYGYIPFDMEDNKGDLKSSIVEARYKFFFKKDRTSFEGLYLAPNGTYGSAKRTRIDTNEKEKVNIAGIGFLLGRQWIFQGDKTNGFILDLNLGLSNYFSNATPNLNDDDVKGIKFRAGVSVGYAF